MKQPSAYPSPLWFQVQAPKEYPSLTFVISIGLHVDVRGILYIPVGCSLCAV